MCFRYQQVAEESFHISKACLEPTSAGKGITSVYIEVDNDEFIVCNLNKEGVMSDSLDLNFVAGEKICFRNVVRIKFHHWHWSKSSSRRPRIHFYDDNFFM